MRAIAPKETAGLLEKAGAPARLRDLAQYNPRDLLEETTVLLIISTWGDGEPPDDGVDFFGLRPEAPNPPRLPICASPFLRWETRATRIFANAEGFGQLL